MPSNAAVLQFEHEAQPHHQPLWGKEVLLATDHETASGEVLPCGRGLGHLGVGVGVGVEGGNTRQEAGLWAHVVNDMFVYDDGAKKVVRRQRNLEHPTLSQLHLPPTTSKGHAFLP